MLDSGALLVNDVQVRARLAKLQQLTDDETYRRELRSAVDELIRVCPEAALVSGTIKDAEEQIRGYKAQLKEYISDPAKKIEQLRFLGQLFDGWTVVKDKDGNILAVERSLSKEAEAFRERVKSFADQKVRETLSRLRNDIEAQNQKLNRLADKAASEKNEQALRDIARNQVPVEVEELKNKLKSLQAELVTAQGKMRDAEMQVDIASHDDRAAEAMAEAAGIEVKADELKLRQAMLLQTQAALQIRKAELQIRQQELQLLAAEGKTQLAQAQLRELYATCRRWGLVPDDEVVDPAPLLKLDGILAVYDPPDQSGTPRGGRVRRHDQMGPPAQDRIQG
ncbi:MAG: hypothetical protein E6K70_22575 [Planctomycetota bacterium]|nr:MAG: hypothetical protein E6K70_22575 [Planctomycetota bacterium]